MYERIGHISEHRRQELLAEPRNWKHCKGKLTDYWSDDNGSRMFVKITPGGRVHRHSDHGYKVHTVLLTNPRCVNSHDGMPNYLEQGGVYKMDASLEHESWNNGETDRIHLIEPWATRDSQ